MKIKVADEVWVATALLHSENPNRDSFTTSEIVDRLRKAALSETVRPGVLTHVAQHCVANKKPNPVNYRMLMATANGNRRLFRNRDKPHELRRDGKHHPKAAELPDEYRHLIQWYLDNFYNREVKEFLKDLKARRQRQFEQELPAFRNPYELLDDGERERCREWLERILEAGEPPAPLQARVVVHIDQVFYTEGGEKIDQGSVQLYPRDMLRAVKKWENDEQFTTQNAFDTF